MFARLQFAAIGAVLGAFVVLVFWVVQTMSMHHRYNHPAVGNNLLVWLKYTAAICAAIGFVLKDRVGDAVGGLFAVLLGSESAQGGGRRPAWLTLLIVIIAVGIVARLSGLI